MRGNASGRRAEEFDALISGRAGDHGAHAELLDMVAALRAVPPVEPRPEYVSSLRTQLVAAAERAALQPATAIERRSVDASLAARLTPRQRPGSRERRLAALVGTFAVVSASGSMAMASQASLPGDTLYPIKRAIENARTNLQGDDAARAATLIAHADARLAEAEKLTADGADGAVISRTLQDFTLQTGQAAELTFDDYASNVRSEPIADLRAFAARSMETLTALGRTVPGDVRPALITASQTVRQVDLAAWETCPTCADGGVAEMPDFATLPLSVVLSGNIPDTASVTQPVLPKDKRGTTQASGSEGEPTPAEPSLTPVAPVPGDTSVDTTDDGRSLPETIKKSVKDIGIDGDTTLDPDSTDSTTSDADLTGTLVDGVSGVVGGLLQ